MRTLEGDCVRHDVRSDPFEMGSVAYTRELKAVSSAIKALNIHTRGILV